MKKLLKRTLKLLVCVAVAVALVRFGPGLYLHLFEGGSTQWLSERFSETLREQNELMVYGIETTGRETVTQEAWLLGTVQRVEMPYTFQMRYTVDLSNASVSAAEDVVEVRVPGPVAGYQKLVVDRENLRKNDWLYPLTPERYAFICQQLEDRLFAEYSASSEYTDNAWGFAVSQLEGLFYKVAQSAAPGTSCAVRVVRDDSLALQTVASAAEISN